MEIGVNRIFIVYLPVSSAKIDKINLCYKGIGQLCLAARQENKKITVLGDFNSHIHGYQHDGPTDHGGRSLLNLIDIFNLRSLNIKEQ